MSVIVGPKGTLCNWCSDTEIDLYSDQSFTANTVSCATWEGHNSFRTSHLVFPLYPNTICEHLDTSSVLQFRELPTILRHLRHIPMKVNCSVFIIAILQFWLFHFLTILFLMFPMLFLRSVTLSCNCHFFSLLKPYISQLQCYISWSWHFLIMSYNWTNCDFFFL